MKKIIAIVLTLCALTLGFEIEAKKCRGGGRGHRHGGYYRRGRGPYFSVGYSYPYAYYGPLDYPYGYGPGWGPYSYNRPGIGFGFTFGG